MNSTASILDVPATPTLLFRVGAVMYGCDIAGAQEIMPMRRMTRLPGAPPCVRGLINMRGTVVTVLDLGVRLDPAQAPSVDGSILLVRHRDRLVGLVVDEVADVRSVVIDEADFAAGAPGTAWGGPAGASHGAVVRGIAMVDDSAVFILDLEQLVTQVLLS